jgi:RNA polymerase sigma factor (sigma-70 family)
MEPNTLRDLLGRVQAGEAAAVDDLLRAYEPVVLRYVRMRLTDRRLRRVVDLADVCQEVLFNLYSRICSGRLEVNTPQDLRNLLAAMVRNKVLDHVRKEAAARRDCRRRVSGRLEAVTSREQPPGSALALRELREQALKTVQGLPACERYLTNQRAQGRAWADLAAELGESPATLRQRHSRAVNRLLRALGIGDPACDGVA